MVKFTETLDSLIQQAEGRRVASCTVDQVYAHYQEVHPEFHHPDGGQAFYMRDSVYLGHHMVTLARSLFDQYGIGLDQGLRQVAEDLAKGVYQRAPWEFNDLRKSGSPKVTRGGATIYSRPASVRRLNDEELRLKHHLSYLFDPHRRSR